MARDSSKDSRKKEFLTRGECLWVLLQKCDPLRRWANALLLNRAIEDMPPRPEPYCNPPSDYTNWEGLTNRRWSCRHLPPAEENYWPEKAEEARMVAEKLFSRGSEGFKPSSKSTLVFPFFAQWFVDGFLVGDPTNRQRNLSTHQIDLSQLYGRHPEITDLIREKEGGRLKSEWIDGAEYPPKLYDADGKIKPEYCVRREGYLGFDDIGLNPVEVEQTLGPDEQPEVGDKVLQRPLAHGVELKDPKGNLTRFPRHLVYQEIPRSGRLLTWEQDSATHKDKLKGIYAIANARGNSTLGFTMMTTLMLREHNRIAGELEKQETNWDDERLFQTTRNILIVLLTRIVVEEYINHLSPYYFKFFCDPQKMFKPKAWKVQNWMTTEFQLLYRWHAMIPDNIQIGTETLGAEQTLWNPGLLEKVGLAGLFTDATNQHAGELGGKNTWEWLISRAETPSIEMGRYCRLRSYNEYRKNCNLPPVTAFNQITGDEEVQRALEEVYGSVDKIEFYTGIFCEDPRANAALGPTIGVMVGVDAFSQALNNPLFHKNIWKEKTFGEYGWKLLHEKNQTIESLLKRNSPELEVAQWEGLKVSMTHPEWTRT